VPKNIIHTYSWKKTLLTSFLIFITFSIIQILILIFFLLQNSFTLNSIFLNPEILEKNIYDFTAPISIYSSLFGILLIIYLSKFIYKGNKFSTSVINEIIPINKDESIGKTVKWFMILFGFALFISISSSWLGIDNTVDFTNQVLAGSGSMILLLYGIGVVQPIFEEFLFRGLLFKGLQEKLGGTLTVFATSILFVLPHIQYDFLILGLVLFPNALILGFARLKTGNLTIPIILHCANNLVTLISA